MTGEDYRLISLPTFVFADMVAEAMRKIGSQTPRAMLTWAHYRCKRFLQFQVQKKNVTVVNVSEAYTSQTCTKLCCLISQWRHPPSFTPKVFSSVRYNV
jgi:transposase